MYQSGELIIQPEYQRAFRWDLEKRSRFIESLLLEMPTPPIYVIELEEGQYELIDGLQRVSSYLSFRDMLANVEEDRDDVQTIGNAEEELEAYDEDDAGDTDYSAFSLVGCDIVKDLNGLRYNDLQAALQIKLKRAFIRLEVLRQGTNPEMKYHMFKRLNTGGEKLTPQEIRNCTIRLIDSTFINLIQRLKLVPSFQETVTQRIAERRSKKRFDEELVLKYFAFRNASSSFRHSVDEFLTGYMESVAKSDAANKSILCYKDEEQNFIRTFDFIKTACGSEAFLAYAANGNKSGFNTYVFEAVVVGVQEKLDLLLENNERIVLFGAKLQELKRNDKAFRGATIGGGKNSPGPMAIRFTRIKEMVDEVINES